MNITGRTTFVKDEKKKDLNLKLNLLFLNAKMAVRAKKSVACIVFR